MKAFNRSGGSDPTPKVVCESAVIAFLFLVREELNLSFAEMCHLFQTFVSNEWLGLLPVLYDINEGMGSDPLTLTVVR
jgi:hypothetical protein